MRLESETGKHKVCPDCGYASGRHAGACQFA
jgi:ribosomal protein L32